MSAMTANVFYTVYGLRCLCTLNSLVKSHKLCRARILQIHTVALEDMSVCIIPRPRFR